MGLTLPASSPPLPISNNKSLPWDNMTHNRSVILPILHNIPLPHSFLLTSNKTVTYTEADSTYQCSVPHLQQTGSVNKGYFPSPYFLIWGIPPVFLVAALSNTCITLISFQKHFLFQLFDFQSYYIFSLSIFL